MINIAALAEIVLAVVFIWMIADAIRYRRVVRTYLRFGVFFSVLISILVPPIVLFRLLLAVRIGMLFPEMGQWFIIDVNKANTALIIAFIAIVGNIIVSSSMGIIYCSMMNTLDVPLTRRLLKDFPGIAVVVSRNYTITVAAVALGSVLYSLLLFEITQPQVMTQVKTLPNLIPNLPDMMGCTKISGVMFGLGAAIVEEIAFRLGIQNFLASKLKWRENRYWIAIVATAALWASWHMGGLDPEYVKFLQVFPMGVALGFLFRRYGTEACIFAHGAFNVIGLSA
jgi:membrane protease YdiL (CAAX protease family)